MTQSTYQAIDPTTGEAFGNLINEMGRSEVESLISRANNQREKLAASTPKERAAILRAIAKAVESKREELIEITMKETALPNGRLTGELSRTVFQLEQFAKMVETGAHLQAIIDLPDANWIPAARPDIREGKSAIGSCRNFCS
jgi:NADP-dependent aldehyde dehydrogenase